MLKMDFINVGYGDAILLRNVKDSRIVFTALIDCGDITIGDPSGKSGRISAADFLKQERINELDLVVVTHLHLDHVGGLQQILDAVVVREIWCNYFPQTIYRFAAEHSSSFSPGAKCLLQAIDTYSNALQSKAGKAAEFKLISESMDVDISPELRFSISICNGADFKHQVDVWDQTLSGNPSPRELDWLDLRINSLSIRIRVKYAGKEILLPGDANAQVLSRETPMACSIIKLPHHGHVDSMSRDLLEKLHPEYAVISVSNSRIDDCPSCKIIHLLMQSNVKTCSTDYVIRNGLDSCCCNAVRFQISEEGDISFEYVNKQ